MKHNRHRLQTYVTEAQELQLKELAHARGHSGNVSALLRSIIERELKSATKFVTVAGALENEIIILLKLNSGGLPPSEVTKRMSSIADRDDVVSACARLADRGWIKLDSNLNWVVGHPPAVQQLLTAYGPSPLSQHDHGAG